MTEMRDHGAFVIARVQARRSSTLVQLAALAGAAVCVAGAAMLQGPINRQRRDLQLVLQSNIYAELPPKYAWISAAGGTFRGLAADYLWVRADRLKEEGKYYESHQLAKWICTLQPRFAAVWSFQSWNMAYNISVATHTGQERWQWVYNGIRLLRDEGIPNNEKVVSLYHQLAWTWFHKVGDMMDDFQMYYKRTWASTMETLLGPPPVGVPDDEAADFLKPVAEAPATLEELLAARPGVGSLVDELARLGVDVRATTSPQRVFHPLELSFFRPYAKYLQERELATYVAASPGGERPPLAEFFDRAAPEDFQALLAFLRAKVLREQYKMDPAFMHQLTRRLGTEKPVPIDWRTPWSQAIYWGMYGTDKVRTLRKLDPFDLLNTDRIILFSLPTIARHGRYIFRNNVDVPHESFLAMMPDFGYIEPMHRKYIEMGPIYADPETGEKVENRTAEILRSGHINFLETAIVALYLAGREEEAVKYWDYLAVHYPDQFTGKMNERYQVPFRVFIQDLIDEHAGSMRETTMFLHSLFYDAYLSLAAGHGNDFRNRMRSAFELYEDYMRENRDDREARRTLPPFEQMRADALVNALSSPGFPLPMRLTIWAREQEEIRRRAYDAALPVITEHCRAAGLDVARAFPEPPGMAEFRASKVTSRPEDVAREAIRQKQEEEDRLRREGRLRRVE